MVQEVKKDVQREREIVAQLSPKLYMSMKTLSRAEIKNRGGFSSELILIDASSMFASSMFASPMQRGNSSPILRAGSEDASYSQGSERPFLGGDQLFNMWGNDLILYKYIQTIII